MKSITEITVEGDTATVSPTHQAEDMDVGDSDKSKANGCEWMTGCRRFLRKKDSFL